MKPWTDSNKFNNHKIYLQKAKGTMTFTSTH